MEEILRINNVSEHDAFYHQENLHPLVSIINFEGTTPEVYASRMSFGFYAVYLKDVRCGDIKYGRDTYDYQAAQTDYKTGYKNAWQAGKYSPFCLNPGFS